MVANWDTEEQQQRSSTYSKCRMSDRNGLGPHTHLSGPKSYREIQDDMEAELGREVSMGEGFFKTHTKPDGSYVDGKAEKSIKLISGSCKRRWLSSRQIPLFQMVLHTVGSSPAMNVLPSFLSALRRIHLELLMVLEASKILLARARAINKPKHFLHCKSN
ncbi:PREDICTED: uncharacterized protein LOC104767947 isoform X1 [Camelina sativa]|uniref:Uncharacterized protein LOC104767947 isoform X1 n=1 Tax=Camelina sativa TaxID=90675 RepID=A0ABM1RCK7_CAMSA|nr:PREDICTED: uncharacterized protein LOC104767948 isoform X1 [Camelina sativa]XP_019096747.1 PREDICTED: uncharacterized protein LOC104767947 isoform X1 [Camelina sativa]